MKKIERNDTRETDLLEVINQLIDESNNMKRKISMLNFGIGIVGFSCIIHYLTTYIAHYLTT